MIDLSARPVGTVLNTYGDNLPGNWLGRQGLKIVYGQIRAHQHHVWPNAPRDRVAAIHSQQKVYWQQGTNGLWGQVTTPRAEIYALDLNPSWRARAFCWEGIQHFTPDCWAAFERVWTDLDGTLYDYGQLVDIKIREWFDWLPDSLPIFDFSRRRKVCSVACMAALYAGWQKLRAPLKSETDYFGRFYPPPNLRANGKKLYLEHVPPAFFENEPRWVQIGEQGFK
jgi:hypothetical protein